MKSLKTMNKQMSEQQNMHLTGKKDIIDGNATPRVMEREQPNVIPVDDDEDVSGDESPQQVSIAPNKHNSAVKRVSPRRSNLSPRQGGTKAASTYQSSKQPMFSQKHRF